MEDFNKSLPQCLSVELIKKYVNKQLTYDELLLVERIVSNCELSSIALEGALLFSDNFDFSENELDLDFTERYVAELLDTSVDKEKTYTYAELMSMFSPVKHYDPVIEQVKRSSAAIAQKAVEIQNSNDDSADKFLKFLFTDLVTFGCEISIENNQEEELKVYVLDEFRSSFMIPTSNLVPGCYYWKLRDAQNKFYIGKFYVDKHLKP